MSAGLSEGPEPLELEADERDNQVPWNELKHPLPAAQQEEQTRQENECGFVMKYVRDFGRACYFHPRSGVLPDMADDAALLAPAGPSNLGDRLRDALLKVGGKAGDMFLPLESMESLLSITNVYRELRGGSASEVVDAELRDLAKQIWTPVERPSRASTVQSSGVTHHPAGPTYTSRRAIFATLVLMEKAQSIRKFIESELWDCHLPFEIKKRERNSKAPLYYGAYDNEGRLISDACFSGWKAHDLESFVSKQWQTLAPYFGVASQRGGKPVCYNLNYPKVMLPFTEKESTAEPGGFSDVWRAQVHPSHFSDLSDTLKNGKGTDGVLVAVKTLRRERGGYFGSKHKGEELEARYRTAFLQEVKALERCSDENHAYLIRLLFTYHCDDHYHLVFPWADRNLQDYWMVEHPTTDSPERDSEFTTWLASQCVGIAEGLQTIHHAPPRGSGRHYGRHGDLKPANILWFRHPHANAKNEASRKFGQFVISDFGLAQFHAEGSKDNVDAYSVAMTDTYRPPEYDVRPKIAPNADIWTLGCIFLELVCWYLRGWAGVDSFSKRRFEEEEEMQPMPAYLEHGIPGDTFFLPPKKSKIEPNTERKVAQLKKSVWKEFKSLHSRPDTTPFIHDLLDLVRKDMLRMKPLNRSGCDTIRDRLVAMRDKCAEPSYCTTPRNRTGLRTPTDLSMLSDANHREPPYQSISQAVQQDGGITPRTPELQSAPKFSPQASPKRPRTNLPAVAEGSSASEHQGSVQSMPNRPVRSEIPRPPTPTPRHRHEQNTDSAQPIVGTNNSHGETPIPAPEPPTTELRPPHESGLTGEARERDLPGSAPRPPNVEAAETTPLLSSGEQDDRPPTQTEPRNGLRGLWARLLGRMREYMSRIAVWLRGGED